MKSFGISFRYLDFTPLPQAIDTTGNDRCDHRRQGDERGEHRVARGFLGAGGGALGRVDCLALQAVGLVQPLDAALLEPFVDPRRLAVEDAAIAHLAHLLEAQGLEPGEELLPGFGHYFLARLAANMPDMSILLRSTFSFASLAARAFARSVSTSAASKASAHLKLNAARILGSGLPCDPVAYTLADSCT